MGLGNLLPICCHFLFFSCVVVSGFSLVMTLIFFTSFWSWVICSVSFFSWRFSFCCFGWVVVIVVGCGCFWVLPIMKAAVSMIVACVASPVKSRFWYSMFVMYCHSSFCSHICHPISQKMYAMAAIAIIAMIGL